MGQTCTTAPLDCARSRCPLLEQDSEVVTNEVEQQSLFQEYEPKPLFADLSQHKPLFGEVYQHKPILVEVYEPMPETTSNSYAVYLAEERIESAAHEHRKQSACRLGRLVFTCLGSVVFGIISVRELGQGLHQVWAATVWSMALLLWAIRYCHNSVLEGVMSSIAQVVKNLKPRNPAYADAYLFYDIGDSMGQRKFLTINILILGSLGLVGLVHDSAGSWIRHLNMKHFHVENRTDISSNDRTMAYLATHPDYSCAVSGLTPLPYMYLLAKLTLGGFVQDLVLHTNKGSRTTTDLRASASEHLSFTSKLFVLYQLSTLVASVISICLRHPTSQSTWGIYQIIAYRIFMGTGFVNVALLACKMLIETNVSETHGSPHSFDRLEWYRFPRFSLSLAEATKGTVFWMSFITVCIAGLPITFTHVIPAFAYSLCAVTFPLWGTVNLVLSYISSRSFTSFAAIVRVGAHAHAQFWGIIGLMYLMVHAAMLLRELLWRVQCAVAGRRVDGKYGYVKGTMALFFAVPLVFVMQSCPIWADLAYGGWDLGYIPFTEFNVRIVQEYNSCFLSGPLYVQILKRLAVL